MESLLENLKILSKEIKKLMVATGTDKKLAAMQEEIRREGWSSILEKYHSDININDPTAWTLFTMHENAYRLIQLEGKTENNM